MGHHGAPYAQFIPCAWNKGNDMEQPWLLPALALTTGLIVGWHAKAAKTLKEEGRRQRPASGRSLTKTQRDFSCPSPSSALSEYETDTAVNEYLHFHYGPVSGVLEKALKGDAAILTSAFEHVKDVCVQHAQRFGFALDVGCSVGRMSFALSPHFEHVDGIDSSLAFIEAASILQRRRAVPYTWNGEGGGNFVSAASLSREVCPERCNFACIDTMDFLRKGAKFDLILACNVLCRLPRPREWLGLLPESLAPTGIVVLVTPFAWLEAWTPKEEWLGDCSRQSSAVLCEIMERNGFVKVEEEELPFLLAQNERIHELFISELTVWKLQVLGSPSQRL